MKVRLMSSQMRPSFCSTIVPSLARARRDHREPKRWARCPAVPELAALRRSGDHWLQWHTLESWLTTVHPMLRTEDTRSIRPLHHWQAGHASHTTGLGAGTCPAFRSVCLSVNKEFCECVKQESHALFRSRWRFVLQQTTHHLRMTWNPFRMFEDIAY